MDKLYLGHTKEKELTSVLFDLKRGFKFEDKGHSNEQITWLIKGNMDFNANSKRRSFVKTTVLALVPNIFMEVHLKVL